MDTFWSEPCDGVPEHWSTAKLENWLQAADSGFTSGLGWRLDNFRGQASNNSKSDLVRKVQAGLDSLYRRFKPPYPMDFDSYQPVDKLPPWSRNIGDDSVPLPVPVFKTTGIGSLERCFNRSYGIQ